MKLSTPVDIKVIKKRDNGSGVIEIPLLPATEIDLARTASGSETKTEITVADLEKIAANFALFPGPVPIGVSPHQEFEDRGGFSPGFVNAVSVRGSVLYGEIDLIAPLFFEVEMGGWRGFSVEIAHNLKTATAELEGWALVGGVFTNRPATDINFRIAATGKTTSQRVATYSSCLKAGEEKGMDNEKQIASLEAELGTQKELVSTLRTQAEGMSGETAALEAKLTEAKKDEAAANIALSEANAKLAATTDELAHTKKQLAKEQQSRREIEVRLEAEQNRSLKEQIIDLVKAAIDRGVSAKHFEGVEEDPVAWFNNRYVSVEAMKQTFDAFPTVTDSAVSSGRRPEGAKANLSSETVQRLRRMGLDPKFAGVTNENQIREMKAIEKEKGN